MRLINYTKHKKWTPRSTVLLLVVESFATGLFLGLALTEAVRSHDIWDWIWPLVMGFASAVGALQAALVALHNYPPPTKAEGQEAASYSASPLSDDRY